MTIKNTTAISYLMGTLTLLLGLFLFFRALLFHLPVNALWANDIDTPLIYWVANWGYHVLFEAHNPAGFFHSNAFYPAPYTLAYSDSLLGLQIFYSPLRLLGVASLPALYLSLALTVLAAGLLSVAALRRIEPLTPLELAFILFGSFFSLSVTNYLIHYQLFGFYFLVPFVLYLFLFLRDGQAKDLALVCALYGIGVSYAVYLAPLLLVYAIFLAPLMIALQLRKRGKACILSLLRPVNVLIVAGFALAIYLVQLRPYFLVSGQVTTDTVERVILFSAQPAALVQAVSAFSYWYGSQVMVPSTWESAYFPGVLLLLLSLGFILTRVQRSKKNRQAAPASHAGDAFTSYMLIFFVVSLLMSFGPYLKASGSSAYSIKMPFGYLASLIPGLSQVRAPGRFGMFIGFPLALLGVRFFQQVRWPRGLGPWALGIAFIALVVESLPSFPLYPFNPDPTGLYRWVGERVRPGQALVELPLSNQGDGAYKIAEEQLVGSTLHWARIASGYGSKETPVYQALVEADARLQTGGEELDEILRLAKGNHFDYLLVNLDRYSPQKQAVWQGLFKRCSSMSAYPPAHAVLLEVASCP